MLGSLLTLLAVLLASGTILFALTVILISRMILRPPRMTDGKAVYLLHRLSPVDLGLPFEVQNFTVRDEHSAGKLQMAGWWIPAIPPTDRCVILLHGYADAKVGSIALAPLLHDLHLNILAVDLRAHGESGGTNSTGGFFERDDLDQIINQLRLLRPQQTKQIILFGLSLGAAVAAAVAARREDLSAVILDSPFPDYRRAVATHARLNQLPVGWILQAALRWAQFTSGANFDSVRPSLNITKISCPLLLIFGQHDELLEESDFQALHDALKTLPGITRWHCVPQAGHLMAFTTDPLDYQSRIREFLDAIFNPVPSPSP